MPDNNHEYSCPKHGPYDPEHSSCPYCEIESGRVDKQRRPNPQNAASFAPSQEPENDPPVQLFSQGIISPEYEFDDEEDGLSTAEQQPLSPGFDEPVREIAEENLEETRLPHRLRPPSTDSDQATGGPRFKKTRPLQAAGRSTPAPDAAAPVVSAVADSAYEVQDSEDTTELNIEPLSMPLGFLIVKAPLTHRGEVYRVLPGENIGRKDAQVIVPHDKRISRPHAQIDFQRGDETQAGYFTITDLDTSNGTIVNGEPIQTTVALDENDEIIMGDTVFLFKTLFT